MILLARSNINTEAGVCVLDRLGLETQTTMRNCSVVLHFNELCKRVWLPWHFSPTHSASDATTSDFSIACV